ncbi:hypothetical protein [Brevibacterium aurantiacum]|uniref:hypothetical protein n=1 Tax=Brevibacterium aurantiacum TaxID=273384 RepID=UPI001F496436|nr:hypothetical protein [Brevibacterium aurantiacum]
MAEAAAAASRLAPTSPVAAPEVEARKAAHVRTVKAAAAEKAPVGPEHSRRTAQPGWPERTWRSEHPRWSSSENTRGGRPSEGGQSTRGGRRNESTRGGRRSDSTRTAGGNRRAAETRGTSPETRNRNRGQAASGGSRAVYSSNS